MEELFPAVSRLEECHVTPRWPCRTLHVRMRSVPRPAALLRNNADRHASRLHRPPELSRPREGHTAVFQWIWKTVGSRPEEWVNTNKNNQRLLAQPFMQTRTYS